MPRSEIYWILSALLGLLALRLVTRDLNVWANSLGVMAERKNLRRIALSLREIEEALVAGSVPSAEKWDALSKLPEPWGSLVFQSLDELRKSGAALLPTMRRLRDLAQEHEAALLDAKARSAQALSQAVLCSMLVPGFGAILYMLLPGVDEHPYQWCIACGVAIAAASFGAALLLKFSSAARWAGLPVECRVWVISAQCAGERFLALVRSGTPADLSWSRAVEMLHAQAPALAVQWGPSIWAEAAKLPAPKAVAAGALIEFGHALKRTVQLSVMEGRPCGERVETALLGLRQEIRSLIDRELSILPTKALRPLFMFVAPSILGLLFFGMYLAWVQVSVGMGGAGFAS